MAEKRNESTTRRGTGTEANASERIYRKTVDVRRRAGDAIGMPSMEPEAEGARTRERVRCKCRHRGHTAGTARAW